MRTVYEPWCHSEVARRRAACREEQLGRTNTTNCPARCVRVRVRVRDKPCAQVARAEVQGLGESHLCRWRAGSRENARRLPVTVAMGAAAPQRAEETLLAPCSELMYEETPQYVSAVWVQTPMKVVSPSEQAPNTGVIFEIVRIQTCAWFQKKLALPEKKSSGAQKSKELRCILKTKMKNPQQKKNVTDAFWDVIHSKLPILPNTNMNSRLNVETDMQRETRLGHSQLMQEKFPNEQKVCFSVNVGGLSSSGKDGKEGEGECESLLASKNSQGFIFNVYQTENHERVKTDEELKQPGSINIQVKLQIHLPQTILDSASCPIFDQFQFGKPETYAKFSPPNSGEAKTDAIFSAKECVVPSDTNHQREETAGIERKKTVTFDSCMSAFSISKRKRNFKQYSDIKTLVRPKCGILKAKKPSISYILNIKGGASPKHREELGCNLTTKMEAVDQGKEMADKMSSFMTIAPDLNMHSKIEKDMLGKKRLRSKQVKQALSLHQENITSDDTRETSLQGEEEEESEQETLLKGVPEQGRYFIFCSGQKEELNLHKSEKEGSGRILFVTEQDVPQQMPPTDPMQVEEPKKSHQTQNGTICTAKSKLPLIKSKDSLSDRVFINPMGGGIPSNGSHPGELYSHGKEEEPELNKNQQATVLQSLAVSTPDPPESKRQRKTFTCTTFKCKMSSKCVTKKARKTPISQMFNIPGKGGQKNLPSKILKSRIFDFLVDINYSEAKNALISQTFSITKRGPPSHRRTFECNFKVMMGKYIPVADIILNAISSALPISFDMNVNNRIKVEIDEPWKMRFSHELQQQEQSPDGEQACCASSSDKRGSAPNSMKKAKNPGGEVAPWNTQHFSFNAPKMTEPLFVYPDVERMNSARKKVPEFLTTAQELQQQTLFTQRVLHPIPRSILNVLPFEKLPKNTQTHTGFKDTRNPKISSPMPGKSIGESLMDAAQSGIPFGKSPGKELANSIPERELRLQKDLPARNLEFSYFSVPASSDFKGQRNAAQIPKSRTRKAQMVSKTINVTRSGALSHGKQQDPILENMAQQRSLEYSMTSGGSPTRKLDVHGAGSLHSKEEKEGIATQKVITHTVDQNVPPTKSGNSVLGDPCDESSRRKMDGHIAKKYEDLQRDLLTRSTMSVLSESKRQKELFKFSEGENLTGPVSVTTKTQKPPCSQTLTVTEHGTLYCRKEQECNSKSTIKDMQQKKSIDNAFSSPMPLSTDDKIDIEMYRTLKAEMDQQRVRFKNSVYLKLEKSACYREAQKANPTDTQNNRSGYTMEMNVQQNKEEVAVETINLMLPKNKEEKMQGSKDGPGVLMTQSSNSFPSLSLLKWNKEMQRVTYAGEIVHIEPINGDIMENVQNEKQHMPQEEEMNREKTVAMRDMTHASDISMKSKKSSDTLYRTELLMNIGSQGQKIHEGQGRSPCTVRRKVHISKPPTDLKLDKGTQVEEEELGIKRPTLFPQMVSALFDAEKTEDRETIGGDVRKRKHLSHKEKDREQNRTKVDQDLLEITGFSFSQLQLPESSGTGNNNYANFNEHISSFNTIIEAYQLMPHTDTKDRVKTEDEKGKKLPQIMTLRMQTSIPTHLLSKKRQPLNIKQKVEDTQKDKGKPDMVLRKACASTPSPFHLKWDTRMNEQEDTLGTMQPCFPLLNIKHSSYSGKKAYATSLEGYMLKKDNRLKRDIEDKMLPMYMDRKAKKLPLCTYSCNKWTTSKSILESKWQNEKHKQDNEILFKARLPFLNSMQCRKDKNTLIAKREAQQQILVSESISESVSSPLMIPFQTEKLQKNMPPIKYILQKLGEIISCPKSGKVRFDYLLADGTEYSTSSGGSPTRKLDVHRAGSLHSKEEKKDIVAQKVIKHTVDQNIPPTKSGNSVLGDPCDESSRRKVDGRIAKKYEDLQRDLLTRSTMSILSESKEKKEVFKFSEGENLTGPVSVTMKTQKPPCSQTLTVTEHGTLYCRKEQECNSKSTIKGMQQNKSIDNAFSSPRPLSTDDKIDIEMYRTLKAEMDQQRVRFKNSVYLKLEKSACHREAQKANPTDTQNNRSGYTMEMNVQQNKEEVAVETINLMLPKNKEEKMQGSKDGPGVLMTQSSNSLQSLSLLKWNKEMQRVTYAGEIVHIEPISGDIMENVQNKKQHMHQEEETNKDKTVAMRGMTHASDISMKSKESPSSDTLQRTELHMSIGSQGQKIHEGQGRSPCTVLRKVHISKPPTDLKLDEDTQVEEEELGIKRPILFPQMVSALFDAEKTEDTETIGGFSFSQLQLPESSGTGNNKDANFNEHISSCNTIVEANQHMSYTDIMDRVKIEEGTCRLLPQIMTLRIQTSPPTHLLSKKRQPLNIKQKVEDTQKDKGKPDMVLRKACASAPSPFHLKWDTRMNEQEDILGTMQPCFPPLKSQHSSYSGKKAYAMSFQGYKLKKDDRLKRDIEDKMLPMYMDLKAKKLPPPHILNIKELRCEIKEQKRKVQEDKNKLVTNIKNICTSLVTLPYLKFEATEREGCMIIIAKEPLPQPQSKESSHAEAIDGELSTDVKELKELMLQKEVKTREKTMDMNSIVDPIDTYLKTKKSPILLIYNLSDLQRKTKEQKGKVQKVEPTGVMLTKTCTSSSPPVHLNMNIRIREKSISPFTRSSVSPVHFQESSNAEKVVYVEPIIPDILISPQEGKQCVPQNKEEVGVETINLTFPIHQEEETQESKEGGFNKPKEIALRNEDDSGVLIRSLFISGVSLSQTEEMVESETKQERKKRICFSKFQEKSLMASEIVERDNSSTVKRGGQNFPSIVPEDSQPSTVGRRQMQKPPSVKPEENLSSEVNKINVTLQTEGGVVSGNDSSRVIKEPDLLTIEQEEKAPKPILTPTECPSMSEDPKGNHRDQSEPIQDTTTQKVQQQNTFSGTVPTLPQVESNEIKIVADCTSKESLLPFYDTIKNVFESQIKNMIQDKVCTDKLDEAKAHCPDDWKSTPFSGGLDITSTTEHPTFQPKPIVESKVLEIKLNLIPKTAKQSFQKFDFYSKRTISVDNSRRLYPRHKKMSFLSLEGIDTIKLNLKHKPQKDSPQLSCMKTLTVVSSGSKEIMTKVKSISKLGSGTSSVTSANKMPMSRILQNYSEEEKDKLLIHFSMKTLETQMKAFPKIVTESYSMANSQARKKPLSKCIYSGVKVPKQKNIISLGFEEKSLHQIELDLRSKYLSFLLGLPVESMIPKPNTLPKHILKLNTAATCKKVDDNGDSGRLSIDTELLEQHISFKKRSPHENSSLIRRFLEPTHACASDPEQHGTAQEDTTILSVLKPHLTPEKDKHHVWFQETASLANYHSIQTFQDFTDRQTDIENSANLEECSALEKHENEQSMFLEANPYLSQESENMLYELQKSIPLENLYKMKQIQTDLKPLYSDNSVSHPVGGCRKPSSAVTTPSYESHSTRKYRAPPTVQSPHWLCHSSLNTVEVPFASPTKLSEEKLLWITESSLAPLTESNLKLHLAKSQDKPHRHLERKKSNLDSYRNNVHWDCYPNDTQRKAKRTREKKVRAWEPERAGYFLRKRKSASKPHQEDFNFHYEGKQNQPFFYACVPADSLEIIPQTIRWTIPQKTLRKRNFKVPLVAKISSSFHMWSFSKKLGRHS
ncbi:coiled-coil domain-containing protein 168 [Myotis lucifugus]|uniref:coiled-coil domain-containing protein 168 n=1 Tax=Myotis lucifugus TaxID=59463 RepID=UPI000CCC5FEC|nr:coiled-coil domain-containing protein 168 [Myotis lucifugus]